MRTDLELLQEAAWELRSHPKMAKAVETAITELRDLRAELSALEATLDEVEHDTA